MYADLKPQHMEEKAALITHDIVRLLLLAITLKTETHKHTNIQMRTHRQTDTDTDTDTQYIQFILVLSIFLIIA